MSGSQDAVKREWVERVLGFTFAIASPSSLNAAELWNLARERWTTACETVDAQIGELQRALRATGDEALSAVAEYGLNGVTGGFKVPLMAAMHNSDTTGPTKSSLEAVAKVVIGLQAHIANDERVMACDENPFGVAVTIRSTLGDALGEMRRAAAAAA